MTKANSSRKGAAGKREAGRAKPKKQPPIPKARQPTTGSTQRRTGGSIGAEGYSYQDEVAAYFASYLVAKESVTFDWPEGTRLETIRLEVPASLVDVVLGADTHDFAFVEAKSGLQLSQKAFTTAIEHFVDLYLNFTSRHGRSFRPHRDRLILAVGEKVDRRITHELSIVLRRFESAGGQPTLDDAATSKTESAAFVRLLTIAKRHWHKLAGTVPTAEDLSQFLHVIRILHIDLGPTGRDRRDTQRRILKPRLKQGTPRQAWIALCDLARDRAALGNAGFIDRDIFEAFQRAGVAALFGPVEQEAAIRRLFDQSEDEAGALEQSTRLVVGGRPLALRATIAQDLFKAVHAGSLFVTGEPGAGKTRTLVEFFGVCRSHGRPTLFLQVGSPFADSIVADPDSRRLLEALRAWSHRDSSPAFLIIDGFDQARAADRRQPFLRLMERIANQTDWTVATTMRRWDLLQLEHTHSGTLLDSIFRGTIAGLPDRYAPPHYSSLRTFTVPLLTNDELRLAVDAGPPALALALEIPSIDVLERIPFNLELLAWLVENDSSFSGDATSVTTQVRLIRRYWNRRVRTELLNNEGEHLLAEIARAMLARRQTIVPLSELNGELRQSPALHHLVSSGVLEEARELGRDGAIRYRFGHTLFFDYALATHVLADAGYRRAILSDKAGLTLIAPSIEMFFDMRWDGDDPARERYWDDILELTGDPKTSAIVVSLAVSTAARKAQSRQDLSPLATALSSPARRLAAVRAVEALVRSLESNNVDVTANGGHPWASLLAALSDALEDTADSGAAATTFRLERQLLSRRNTLDAEAYAATARAARTLLHGLLRE